MSVKTAEQEWDRGQKHKLKEQRREEKDGELESQARKKKKIKLYEASGCEGLLKVSGCGWWCV